MTVNIIDKSEVMNYNHKNIDSLIDEYAAGSHDVSDYQICKYILVHYPKKFLTILKSETNTPSKHDLTIINQTQNLFKVTLVISKCHTYEEILHVYKIRKII